LHPAVRIETLHVSDMKTEQPEVPEKAGAYDKQ